MVDSAPVQASVLHVCVVAPLQAAPVPDGAGFVQERVSVPPPHEVEQTDQADQPPFAPEDEQACVLQL